MKFRKTLNRRINEDFENLEAFFDAVKKEFKKDCDVRASGIPGGGANIFLSLKNPIFGVESYNIYLPEDPVGMDDFSRSITVNIKIAYDIGSEKVILKRIRERIEDVNERLINCKEIAYEN